MTFNFEFKCENKASKVQALKRKGGRERRERVHHFSQK